MFLIDKFPLSLFLEILLHLLIQSYLETYTMFALLDFYEIY